MGCCFSKVSPLVDIIKRSIQIDSALAEDSRVEDEKIKLLFLGAEDSGKKIVFDKMDHGRKYSKIEKSDMVHKIHSTIIRTIKLLISHVQNNGDDLRGDFRLILSTDESEEITPPIGTIINTIWDDPAIKSAWTQRSELHIDDGVEYWFTIIDKVKRPDYTPDKDDLLAATAQFTSGVKVGRRVIDNTTFEMYDVVRQRGRRRKWIHCFENVITAIVFVVDVSAFDQVRSKRHAKNVVVSKPIDSQYWPCSSILIPLVSINTLTYFCFAPS